MSLANPPKRVLRHGDDARAPHADAFAAAGPLPGDGGARGFRVELQAADELVVFGERHAEIPDRLELVVREEPRVEPVGEERRPPDDEHAVDSPLRLAVRGADVPADVERQAGSGHDLARRRKQQAEQGERGREGAQRARRNAPS